MSECVEVYMERRAPQHDPSWQVSAGSKFSEGRKQASQQAYEKTRSFKVLIGTFVRYTKRQDLARFDVNRSFHWEDVKNMASDVMERDADKAKWRRNPIRAAGRSLQKSASNLEILLGFLPNDEFTGTLCGALTLVFCAAKRLDDVRNKILNCLESLPELVGQTEAYVEIYDDDPKVWSAAEDLYLGILEGVEGMLLWIDKSALERAWKSLLFPATFGKDEEENVIKRNIDDKVVQFREVVQVSLHRTIQKQSKTIRTMTAQLENIVSYAQWRQDNPQAAILFKTSFLNLDQLRGVIDVDPQVSQRDMETGMLDAQNVDTPNLINHSMCVLRNTKFTMWLQSNMSQMLLINGRMKLSSEQETASPLTMLSCVLSQSIIGKSGRGLPLVYLCGQHNAPQDPYQGPNGMLRCLDSQLVYALTQEQVDLSAVDLTFVDGIKSQNTGTLCRLFQLLLYSATGRVIFVIIDGISWMEEGSWAQGFGNVVVFFRNLVNELNRHHTGLIFKVLLTNPSTSLYGYQWLPDADILEMDDVEEEADL